MKTGLTLLVALAAAGLLYPSPVPAQDADDIGHGREIAPIIRTACHVVARGTINIAQERSATLSHAGCYSGHDYHRIDRRVSDLTSIDAQYYHPVGRRDVIAYIVSSK